MNRKPGSDAQPQTADVNSLAVERTKLANERTLLSYVRTGLYFMVAGFSLISLQVFNSLVPLGYVFTFSSFCIIAFGVYTYRQRKKLYRISAEK